MKLKYIQKRTRKSDLMFPFHFTLQTYSNCSCVPKSSNQSVSTVKEGTCISACNQLYIILPLIFVFTFATISADVPAEQAVLRYDDIRLDILERIFIGK